MIQFCLGFAVGFLICLVVLTQRGWDSPENVRVAFDRVAVEPLDYVATRTYTAQGEPVDYKQDVIDYTQAFLGDPSLKKYEMHPWVIWNLEGIAMRIKSLKAEK